MPGQGSGVHGCAGAVAQFVTRARRESVRTVCGHLRRRPNEVLIDLEFCDETAAQAFLPKLEQIVNSPQAQAQLVRHSVPRLYAVVTERVPSATG